MLAARGLEISIRTKGVATEQVKNKIRILWFSLMLSTKPSVHWAPPGRQVPGAFIHIGLTLILTSSTEIKTIIFCCCESSENKFII